MYCRETSPEEVRKHKKINGQDIQSAFRDLNLELQEHEARVVSTRLR